MEVDNTFGPLDIAISGLRAQSRNLEIVSSNLANARTTDAGDGQAYRRLEPVFEAVSEGISGVDIERILTDMSELPRVLDPGHPQADKDGYVTLPNVDIPVEMINLTIASRTYQANAAVLRRYQQMVETALELLK